MYHPQYKTTPQSRPQLVQGSRLKFNGGIHVKAPVEEKRKTSEQQQHLLEVNEKNPRYTLGYFHVQNSKTQFRLNACPF